MIEAVEAIRLEIEGPLARLILDRPRVLNAGNRRWVADLNEAVARIAAAPHVRVVVITGAGRAFCTGVDLTELAAGEFGLEDFIAWEDAMIAIERMDRLFVAGINGHCLGGGLQLALVCDYRLASEDALLGLPAVKECLIPSLALYRLPRLIGAARAQELILLGEPLDARTAERYHLVNRVVPATEFPGALDETVDRFLALPPPASGRASCSPAARSTSISTPSGSRCRPTSRSAWTPTSIARPWTPSGPAEGSEGQNPPTSSGNGPTRRDVARVGRPHGILSCRESGMD